MATGIGPLTSRAGGAAMSWEASHGVQPAPNGTGGPHLIGPQQPGVPVHPAAQRSTQSDARSSLALSLGGLTTRDDPRVIAALETYLESLRDGRPWSRADFLARHGDIADVLGECLTGLELIQAAAPQFGGRRLLAAADPADGLQP